MGLADLTCSACGYDDRHGEVTARRVHVSTPPRPVETPADSAPSVPAVAPVPSVTAGQAGPLSPAALARPVPLGLVFVLGKIPFLPLVLVAGILLVNAAVPELGLRDVFEVCRGGIVVRPFRGLLETPGLADVVRIIYAHINTTSGTDETSEGTIELAQPDPGHAHVAVNCEVPIPGAITDVSPAVSPFETRTIPGAAAAEALLLLAVSAKEWVLIETKHPKLDCKKIDHLVYANEANITRGVKEQGRNYVFFQKDKDSPTDKAWEKLPRETAVPGLAVVPENREYHAAIFPSNEFALAAEGLDPRLMAAMVLVNVPLNTTTAPAHATEMAALRRAFARLDPSWLNRAAALLIALVTVAAVAVRAASRWILVPGRADRAAWAAAIGGLVVFLAVIPATVLVLSALKSSAIGTLDAMARFRVQAYGMAALTLIPLAAGLILRAKEPTQVRTR